MRKLKIKPDYDYNFVPTQVAIINESVTKLEAILAEQDGLIVQLREKLAAQSRYVDLVSRCDVIGGKTEQGSYWHVSWLDNGWQLTIQNRESTTQQAVNDPLEALAIIDGTTPSNAMELEATDAN